MGPSLSVLFDFLICWFYCFFFVFFCAVYVVYVGQYYCDFDAGAVGPLCACWFDSIFVVVVAYIGQCYTVTMMLVQWVPL